MPEYTRIADALEEAGRQLQLKYRDLPIPVGELRALVVELYPSCKLSSVLPSDHCYNRVCKGPGFPPDNDPMFLVCDEKYLFVGRNSRIAEGPITHYPDATREPIQVGEWVNGKAISSNWPPHEPTSQDS